MVLLAKHKYPCLQMFANVCKQTFAKPEETRGWYRSGGEIDCAGEKDQRDISEVISYTLNHSALALVAKTTYL